MFNTYGSKLKSYGGGKVVWRTVEEKYPCGATIDISALAVGEMIKAGTPIALKPASHVATVLKDAAAVTTATTAKQLIAYVENDVVKEDGDTIGTCAAVVAGQLYVDRCDEKEAAIAANAYCPKVTLVYDEDPAEE